MKLYVDMQFTIATFTLFACMSETNPGVDGVVNHPP